VRGSPACWDDPGNVWNLGRLTPHTPQVGGELLEGRTCAFPARPADEAHLTTALVDIGKAQRAQLGCTSAPRKPPSTNNDTIGSFWLPWRLRTFDSFLTGGVVSCSVGPLELVGSGLRESRESGSPPPRERRHGHGFLVRDVPPGPPSEVVPVVVEVEVAVPRLAPA
jgi:hypothetical protein